MLYRKVDCPHCGNEIVVNNGSESQKCQWCRRLVGIKFERLKGKKFKCEVEAIDFPKSTANTQRKRNYSNWEKDDIYGI
jgi:hypothetical protein